MKTSSIGLGILSAALLCGAAGAAETYGDGAQALPMQQSGGTARAMGMGSAVVAVSQGSASLLWNPAGLGRMSSKEVGLHHNSGLGGTLQEILVLGTPLGPVAEEGKGGALGGLAASLGYVNYGSIQGADELGQRTGTYRSGDFNGSLGWGMELLPGFSGGAVLKGNHSSFGGKTFATYSADAGLLWKALPSLDLGVAYTNLQIGGGIAGAPLASGWRLGAGWAVTRHWLLAAATELQEKEAMRRVQLGTEVLIGDVEKNSNVLALRGGYQLSFPSRELGALAGMTLGVGYTLTRSIAVDYALLPSGDLGASHRLSLTFKFHTPGQKKS
ncbi:MAG: hypothetical protein NUW21_08350 [Elusimicrobia bacterium]|nr:hypothetical protein [Elusimicrobiota bacterium]